jgi:hypothetical protein
MKTLGAVDKVLQRKTRSDSGKRRTTYKNKPTRSYMKYGYLKRRKLVKHIGMKSEIKLRMFWRIPMSRDGYNNWNINLRPKLWKEITKMQKPIMAQLSEIDTQEKFEDFVAVNYWAGKWVVMGLSNAKTKTHRKWVHICTIIVKETDNGNVGRMIVNKRLSKYSWFYRG